MATTCVFTHRDPAVVGDTIDELIEAAERHGLELIAAPEEADKHPALRPAAERAERRGWPRAAREADTAVVLAGDGTLLRVLSDLRGGPPVLGVNYGLLGYLSGIGYDRIDEAVGKLALREFHTVSLPSLSAQVDGGEAFALNDIVASGGVTGGIIEVAWRIVSRRPDGIEQVDEMGVVPCDGMVLATPVGSTAYNLSNGGPVMAWGVEGYVVSFIAPHTLAARPLVVAPGDTVEIEHMGRGAPLQVFGDGRPAGRLEAGCRMRVTYGTGPSAHLALIDDKSFYRRYRENFAVQTQRFVRSRVTHPGPIGTRHVSQQEGAS